MKSNQNNNFLTPKENSKTLNTPGNAVAMLIDVTSHNNVCFNLPTNLSLEIEYDLNGTIHKEPFHINSNTSINDLELKTATFPKRHIAFNSYLKITVIDNSKETVDYKLFLNYRWASN